MLLLKKTTIWHLFLIISIALLVTIPALFYGAFDAHDVKAHFLWSHGFSRQFWQGEFYPRWLSDAHGGLGSPSFFFYPPLPYYITSLFQPLFTGDSSGWLALASSACLSLILSGIAAYFWLKEITKKSGALIGAIAYMILPYHLTINLYLRFAFAEYWAFVWLPLILYFSIRYIKGIKLNLIGIIISYFLLSVTHLLTFIIFAFVPIIYAIAIVNYKQKFKIAFHLLLSLCLGLGLSAIYWLPAITTQDNISTRFLWENAGFLYYNNFLFLVEKIDWRIPFWNYLELLTLFIWAIAILSCFFISSQNSDISKREISYWLFISFASILMMTSLSQWVWVNITILHKLQFPWRFHSLLNLSISAAIAFVFSSLEIELFKILKKPAIALLLTLSIGLTTWISYSMYSVQDETLKLVRVFIFFGLALLPIFTSLLIIKSRLGSRQAMLAIAIFLIAIAICFTGGWAIEKKFHLGFVFNDKISQPERLSEILAFKRDPPEYRPRWFNDEIWWSDEDMTKLSNNINKAKVVFGKGSVSVEQWKPRNIILRVNTKTGISIKIGQLYYQGWSAKIIKSDRFLSTYPDRGLVGIFIPQGKHRILVKLEAGIEERLGQLMSIISAIIILGAFSSLWRGAKLDKRSI